MAALGGATALSSIGIDVGERTVAAVQLAGDPDRWRVYRAAVFARPRAQSESTRAHDGMEDGGHASVSPDEADAVTRVLRRRGFRGRSASMSMPHGEVVQALVSTPPAESGAPIDRLAKVELARMIRLQPGELETACWEVETSPSAGVGGSAGGTGHEVLAVGCKRYEAESLAAAFDASGYVLRGLDAAGCALAVGVDASSPTSAGLRLGVDLGWSATRILAVQHGRPAYQRALPDLGLSRLHARARSEFGFGGVVLDRALRGEVASTHVADAAEHLVSRFVEALVREVRTSLGYVEDGFVERADEAVTLVGGGATIPSVSRGLEQSLGVRIELPRVGGGSDPVVGPESVQALGLALRFE